MFMKILVRINKSLILLMIQLNQNTMICQANLAAIKMKYKTVVFLFKNLFD